MKMRLFTLVWGNTHLDWFERALCASLAWPENRAAVRAFAAEWNIYSKEGERDRLLEIVTRSGLGLEVPLQFHPFATMNSSGETLQPCLLDHLRNCVQTGHAAMLAPPDTVFAEGALGAIAAIGQATGVAVCVPHVRVNSGCVGHLGRVYGAPDLVDLAWQNLHPTWRDASADLPQTNSFLGGVSWRRIRPGLYAVSHRLPTPYWINANASDVEWFTRQFETGTIDHTFPAKLAKEQRLRTIASSDLAFLCELTQPHENIPLLAPADANEPDKFWRDLEHNYVQRNVISTFRGTGA